MKAPVFLDAYVQLRVVLEQIDIGSYCDRRSDEVGHTGSFSCQSNPTYNYTVQNQVLQHYTGWQAKLCSMHTVSGCEGAGNGMAVSLHET